MNEAVLRNLVQRARMLDPHTDAIEEEEGTRTVEKIAGAILQEIKPDQGAQILEIWQRLFGMKLDQKKVTEHLEMLRRWQRRPNL